MRLYVGHSKDYDFKNSLYRPIRESLLNKAHTILLPHEHQDAPFNSPELMKTIDLFIAEVSLPSIGLGIELGWADRDKIPIAAVFRTGLKMGRSVQSLPTLIFSASYGNDAELIQAIENSILTMTQTGKWHDRAW